MATMSESAEQGVTPTPAKSPSQDSKESRAESDPAGEELFIALVYPVGTESSLVTEMLKEALVDVGYSTSEPTLHLIEELQKTQYGRGELDKIRTDAEKVKEYEDSPKYFRDYMEMMDLGNALRKDVEAGAMGLFAASRILKRRLPEAEGDNEQLDSPESLTKTIKQRHAYLIRSLKVPDEINRLRNIYGDALIVVAAHSDDDARRQALSWKIAKSAKKAGPIDESRPFADRLIARDGREGSDDWGQRVSDAFPMADVFVDASHPQRVEDSIRRFVEIIFRHRFRTPTKDEYGMFHAYGAALRSADLSRQVGASIVDEDGEIVALGTNEVPKAQGGSYWPDEPRDDGRDFTFRRDIATEIKKSALDQFLEKLKEAGLLAETIGWKDVWDDLQGTDFMNVGEFGRATHAEMGAIVHAARRGRPTQGCTLYTTTFPCHVCARHIVQAGIRRVVYNEPYPKSYTGFLHPDSIVIGGPGAPNRVLFEPFVGVSPALYAEVFRVPKGSRRTPDGRIPVWPRREARSSRVSDPISYISKEVEALQLLAERLEGKGKPGV